MDLLLDTHAVLWALYSPEVLPQRVREWMAEAATRLFVSEGTVWEITDKAAKGRLPLAGNSPTDILRDIETLRATLIPIERADILSSVSLPLHHSDPFDRLYIAQAQARRLVLVSKDAEIAKYDVTVIWK